MGTCGLLLFLTAVVVGSAQLVSAQYYPYGYGHYPYGSGSHPALSNTCESDEDCNGGGYTCQEFPAVGRALCVPSSYVSWGGAGYNYPYYGYGYGYGYPGYGYGGYSGYPYGYGYGYPYYGYAYGGYSGYSGYSGYGYPYNYGSYPYYGHPYLGYVGEGTAEPGAGTPPGVGTPPVAGTPPSLTPEQEEEMRAKHEEMRKKAEEAMKKFWENVARGEGPKPGNEDIVPMGGNRFPPPPQVPGQGQEQGQGRPPVMRGPWIPPQAARGQQPPVVNMQDSIAED
ncbi:keratin, type II cytoskeletal 2 epidermal-like isoform X1 [Branchiostoma lanceolatum]|uniref:keratin, type II cytoskeletal 2 epidermal-like isoform X1 n=1 Tax=Branchiostoma lanceolatum TaxID=7740 RepID=UPI003454B1D6